MAKLIQVTLADDGGQVIRILINPLNITTVYPFRETKAIVNFIGDKPVVVTDSYATMREKIDQALGAST